SADGTMRATAWESRSLPEAFFQPLAEGWGFLVYLGTFIPAEFQAPNYSKMKNFSFFKGNAAQKHAYSY
ncbi:MAG TPA: hypothetical protein PKI30_00555, partial [Bacillota bacterium]|nr:hypothetical protein [Bacillota bacterium]